MAEKKKFLLRIDENIYNALEKWAADELRSINAQIEFLLKEILKKSGRLVDVKENNQTKENEKSNN
ncbi:Arc family DNA-binding protein [Rosettibacter firmus]|uniref:Arc family DNA-binding protein n=1 Tax=Rosettibacter firmus TaxID=3111522 RepID=UPI00336BE32F